MALFSTKNVSIRGIAACVPQNIEENTDELPVFSTGESERVVAQTGIERKHVLDDQTTGSDLCKKAFESLIEQLGWDRESIEALCYVTTAPDFLLPPTGCTMQDRLGLSEDCFTVDVNSGCPGWVVGLNTLSSLISTGNIKRALLLVADTPTKVMSKFDKETRPLFGDAGTVTALEYNEDAPEMYFDFGTRGSGAKAISRKDGGAKNPLSEGSLIYREYGENMKRRDIDVTMDGMDVFAFGMSTSPKSVLKLIETYNIDINAVDKFVFHQANKYMNERIRKKLKVAPEKYPYSLKDFGNTGNASIPLTIVSQCNCDYSRKYIKTIASAFGVGLSWGSVYFETDKIVCPELLTL